MLSKCEVISYTSIYNFNDSVQVIKFYHVIALCSDYNTTAKDVIYILGT
jgi:hypothetical protein